MKTYRQKIEPQGKELARYWIWLNAERTDFLGTVARYPGIHRGYPITRWKAITPGPGSMEEYKHLTMRSAIDALLVVQCLKES